MCILKNIRYSYEWNFTIQRLWRVTKVRKFASILYQCYTQCRQLWVACRGIEKRVVCGSSLIIIIIIISSLSKLSVIRDMCCILNFKYINKIRTHYRVYTFLTHMQNSHSSLQTPSKLRFYISKYIKNMLHFTLAAALLLSPNSCMRRRAFSQ